MQRVFGLRRSQIDMCGAFVVAVSIIILLERLLVEYVSDNRSSNMFWIAATRTEVTVDSNDVSNARCPVPSIQLQRAPCKECGLFWRELAWVPCLHEEGVS